MEKESFLWHTQAEGCPRHDLTLSRHVTRGNYNLHCCQGEKGGSKIQDQPKVTERVRVKARPESKTLETWDMVDELAALAVRVLKCQPLSPSMLADVNREGVR